VGVVVALVGLAITLVIVNFAVYLDRRGQMNKALERIIQHDKTEGGPR